MRYIKTKDDFINEAVSVETNRYERSHGKKPRGTGQWAFYFTSTGGEPIFVPKAMSYSDAVKWAKGEAKKAGETTIYVGESLDEKRSSPYGEIMLDLDAAMKKAIKKGVTTLSYAKDYVQSLERMAKKNAKRFFKDYQDFTEDDWIEDVRYNMANEKVNEGRAAADRLLKDVVKGNTNSVEGVKMSKEMAEAFLDWLKMSTYGKKFGKLPFDKLFTASFNWGLDRYIKGYNVKDEFKELKAKAKEMKESLTEAKGDKAVSMAQKKLDKVMADLKANLLKFKGAKTDADKETFKTEAGRLTQLRKDAHDNLEQAIQDAYADVDLVVMENYDTEQRKEMASKGLALPDGSFPIKNLEDLKNAIQAYGRAKDQAAAAKFIAKRAKALSAEDLIPDTEDFQKALKEAEFGRIPKFGK